MKKVFLWIFSILFITVGVSVLFGGSSVIGPLLFFITGAYVSPIFRDRYLSKIKNSSIVQSRYFASTLNSPYKLIFLEILIVLVLLVIAGGKSMVDDMNERSIKEYQSNAAGFADKIKQNVEAKQHFLALNNIDNLISLLPNDQALKTLRHEITIDEIKFHASEGKLYHFNKNDFEEYKDVMGTAAKTDEIQKQYTDQSVQYIKKMLAKKDFYEAKAQVKLINTHATNDKLEKELSVEIAAQETKALNDAIALKKAEQEKAVEELVAKRKAAEEESAARIKAANDAVQALQNSNSGSNNGLSRVVAKVGSLIYLANQQTFAIERPTMLHIDGQIYPKGSGSPDYIQVGYRCRWTGRSEFEVVEVFCER
jgi:hypothetical protein